MMETVLVRKNAWFLEDGLRDAIEQALGTVRLKEMPEVTYAGIEDGYPVLELCAEEERVSAVNVAGPYGKVLIRFVQEPVGCVLHRC